MCGFKNVELQQLLLHWRVPLRMSLSTHSFHGEESMPIFLHCMRTGTPVTQMASSTFGGDSRTFSHSIRAMTNHLHETFHHKISGDSMRQWVPSINDFRTATWDQLFAGLINEKCTDGSEINCEVHLPLDVFRTFGWLDDTDTRTDRLRSRRLSEEDDALLQDTQQAFCK
jgi:hypothetical protein